MDCTNKTWTKITIEITDQFLRHDAEHLLYDYKTKKLEKTYI